MVVIHAEASALRIILDLQTLLSHLLCELDDISPVTPGCFNTKVFQLVRRETSIRTVN
jgi:hypothetical protein